MPTISEPKIVERPAQPFAGIELEVAQSEIGMKAPPLIATVIDWLKARGLSWTGPPFFNYTTFKPGGRMVMQVGMPIAEPVSGDGHVIGGALPGGRYASVTNIGPYNELYEANMALDQWARANGHRLDGSAAGDEFHGATRLEIYHADPGGPSDPPVTEIAFRLAN